jgi:hypothetical protein
MRTAYATPWALVLYGAQTPGKRPGTRLGFITEALTNDGVIVAYRVYTFSPRGQTPQRPKTSPRSSLLRTWKHCPTTAQLQAARRALKPSPTPDTPHYTRARVATRVQRQEGTP